VKKVEDGIAGEVPTRWVWARCSLVGEDRKVEGIHSKDQGVLEG
jgi:hypothetical protein